MSASPVPYLLLRKFSRLLICLHLFSSDKLFPKLNMQLYINSGIGFCSYYKDYCQCANMLIFELGNEILRMAIVNNSSTHAITISQTVQFNVRSLIGCLFMLLLNLIQ